MAPSVKNRKAHHTGIQDPARLLELDPMRGRPLQAKPSRSKRRLNRKRKSPNSNPTPFERWRRNQRWKTLRLLSEYYLSKEEEQQAYGKFARAALEDLKNEATQTFSFANWQKWTEQLPEGSLGRAMLEDEDSRPMPEHDYDLKEEMILRLLVHEAEALRDGPS